MSDQAVGVEETADGGSLSGIRLLWTSKGLGLGGAEQLALQIARRLVAEGAELHLAYALSPLDDMASEFERAGVVLHDLGGRRNLDPRWVINLWVLVRKLRPHVLHGHNPLTTSVGRLAARVGSRGTRLVSTVHSVRELWKVPTRIAFEATSPLDDWTFYVAARALESAPWSGIQHELLYHGIDGAAAARELADPEITREQLGLAPDDFVIVMIATLRAEKRVSLACDVLMRLRQSGLEQAHLVLVGGGAELAVAQAAAARSDGHIHVLGPQPEGYRYLAIADAMLMTSWTEGLPVSTMEAVHMGVPIVAPHVGGLPEIVDSDEVGYLCEEPHGENLTKALLALASSLPGRTAGPHQKSVAKWSVEAASERYSEVYRQLARSQRA